MSSSSKSVFSSEDKRYMYAGFSGILIGFCLCYLIYFFVREERFTDYKDLTAIANKITKKIETSVTEAGQSIKDGNKMKSGLNYRKANLAR